MLQSGFLKLGCLALWAIVSLASPLWAQQWAEKMFERRSHDFGTIARGAKAEYEFVLKNLYVEDVHIAGVRVSCGCTTPKIKKELLKTYEQGAIIASINSDRFTGRHQSTITVTFDKPARARVQLHVKVYIRPDVTIEPEAVELGDVAEGHAAEKTITVRCTRRSTWKILEVRSANPHLSGGIVDASRRSGRSEYQIRVRLAASAPVGYLRDHLILVTNDSQAKQIPVMVQARVISAITVSPATLFWGTLQPGQRVTRRMIVRGTRPFCITSIEADEECFEFAFPSSDTAKPLHVVSVTFIPGQQPGKVVKTIRIRTDAGEAPISLETYAAVKPP